MRMGGFICGAGLGLVACQVALDLDDYTFAADVPAYSGSGGGAQSGGAQSGGANSGGANSGDANVGSVSAAGGGGIAAAGVAGAGGGGIAAAGAAGSAGGTSGGSVEASGAGSGTGPLRIVNGYATNGPFHGYSYTFVVVSTDPAARPVTLSPVCDDNGCVPAFDGDAICARGLVGSAPDFASAAYAGLDLNQDQETGTSDSLTLAGQSLALTFSNAGGSELRVQLVAPDGTTYCHALAQAASPAVLPLGEFNTACWDGTGTGFVTSSPVLALHLVVPSLDDVDVPFDFCLLDVATR